MQRTPPRRAARLALITILLAALLLNVRPAAPVLAAGADTFGLATSVPEAGPFPYLDPSDTTSATTQAGEPVQSCAGGALNNTIWYKFTPAASATYRIDTIGSNYDTVLSVWTGSTLISLTEQACDDQGGGGGTSALTIALTAGTEYFIRVGSVSAGGGTISELSIELEPSLAMDIAEAMTVDPGLVTGAGFVTTPDVATGAVFTTSLTIFPTNGPSYGALSSGDKASIPNPATFASNLLGGDNFRGNTDYDVTILSIDLDVPSDANCLSFDLQFLSEEYPHYVNTQYNDAFLAELDTSTWKTINTQIYAPDNFAFDALNNVISINSVVGLSAANGTGTAFDGQYDYDGTGQYTENGGATGLLVATTPITPGLHTLYLSIFDQGDQKLDSVVFLDGLRAYNTTDCQSGATNQSDYGDLPSGYGLTNLIDNGARHSIGVLRLGSLVDPDSNGQESSTATGDDTDGTNDDGVAVTGTWNDGTNGGAVEVTVSGGTGHLNGWIDWNNDLDFDDAGEHIVSNTAVTGTQTLQFDVPAGTLGGGEVTLNARFRVFASPQLNPATAYEGLAAGGEVEDYQWSFGTPTAITLSTFEASQSSGGTARPALSGIVSLAALLSAAVLNRRRRKE